MLSRKLDNCKILQLREDKHLGTKFFRFRALVDVSKPLQQTLGIGTPDGTTHAGLLKYERLPNFCFSCGLVGHRFRACPTAPSESLDVENSNYGAWMGASTMSFRSSYFPWILLVETWIWRIIVWF